MNNDIGSRIKSLRVKNRLNQTELAEKIGVKQVAVSMIEKGINKPTLAQIEVLGVLFGVTIDYLITGNEVGGVSNEDRAILNAVKGDSDLLNAVKAILTAKKNIMSKAA